MMKNKILLALILVLFGTVGYSQVFTDNTAHSLTNSTAWSVTIPVSGVSSSEILRQVTLSFGGTSIYAGDLSKTTITLTNPVGVVTTLMDPAHFTNYSNASNKYFNITLRDQSNLYTPGDWSAASGNTISNGYPFNYGYWKSVGTYGNFNGNNHNGNWTITITSNSATPSFPRKYTGAKLVFGDAFTFKDITTTKPNQSCATKQCIQTGTVYTATNIGYPTQTFPLNIGGCQWNNDMNNASWFYFTASNSTVKLSISGITQRLQSVVAQSSDCNNFTLANGGCPSTMFSTTPNPTQYYIQSYNPGNGSSQNHGYTLTGLTVGQEYILIIDGEAGVASNYSIEIESGADGGCCPTINLSISKTKTNCSGNTGSITVNPTGGVSPYTYNFDDGNGFVSSNSATGLAAGTYNIKIKDKNGCEQDASVTVGTKTPPTIDNIDITDPSCGASDGKIVVTASGGTGTLNYSIDGGTTTQPSNTFSGLASGSLTVSVIDASGCQTDNNISLTAASGPSIDNLATTPPTCATSCDGAISATVSGGITPYTYEWTDHLGNPIGTNSASISGLCAGDYSLKVTSAGSGGGGPATIYSEDFNSGAPNWTLNVSLGSEGADPNFFKISDDEGGVTPPGCGTAGNGDPTLYITSVFNPAGGAAYDAGGGCPYLYCPETHRRAISPNISTVGATGLTLKFDFIANGDIPNDQASVWYNDGGGWTQLGSALYSGACGSGQGKWTAYAQSLPTSCENISNLQIAIQWDNNDDGMGTDPSVAINNLEIVTASAGGGTPCSVTQSVTITAPSSIAISTSKTDATCGNSDGTATASANGGTGTLHYQWNDPANQTSATATGLAAGTYQVTVTDDNGCSKNASITVGNTSGPSASTSIVQNVSCNGGNDGSATASASGGTSPYTYSWDNGETSATATGLDAGSHTVTVTDKNGCTATSTVSITEPTALSASISGATDITCNGGNDGAATASGSGGTSPYSYSWDDGETTATATALDAGSHTVTVTDDKGCTATQNITIAEPTALSASISGATDVTCNGGTNGAATASGSGGTSPYSYSWDDGETTATATALDAGSHTITVTDDKGCTATQNVTIAEPTALSASISGATDVTCNGGNDGAATASGSGGTSPYSYSWDDGETTATATALDAGSHTVTVTDKNGCTTTQNVTLSEPTAITISITNTTDASCGNSDGSATVSATGGTGTLNYQWDSNAGNQTGATASNLAGGTYVVTVTDQSGCSANKTVPVNTTNGPTISASIVQNVTCNGGNDGAATASASGGNSPYTYAWDNGETGTSASALDAGAHSVTVTDDNGCTATQNISITEPTAISVTINGTTDVTCNGDSDGAATASASGGLSPYTYAWDNGETTATATGLNGGSHTVTVTDASGCTATQTVTIAEPNVISVSITNTNDASCGNSDGSATVSATGGTGTINYQWDSNAGNQTGATASNLSAGSYVVTVSDGNGCSVNKTVNINSASGPTVTTSLVQNTTCNGGSDGSATANVTGGASPYTYAWDNGETTATATALDAGSHTVTVTDQNGCATTSTISITEPTVITISEDNSTDASCGNSDGSATVSATGGTGAFTYQWDSNAGNQTGTTASNLSAGSYVVTATDANGCSNTLTITIDDLNNTMSLFGNVDHYITCHGDTDGALSISITGGTDPHTFSWSNGETDSTLTNLSAGNYVVTVTDANGCESTDTLTLDDPPALSLQSSITTMTCGQKNGRLAVNAIGGMMPYAYNWSNGETSPSIANLTSGNYSVTLIDANGCTIDTAFTVGTTGELPVDVQPQSSTINAGESVGITTLPNGSNYTYSWTPPTGLSCTDCPNPTASPDVTTTYIVKVTDTSNNCTGTDTLLIAIKTKCGKIYVPNIFSPNGDGLNDEFCVRGKCIKSYHLQIFDRWGETVFESNSIQDCWGGTYRGKVLNTGVFVYKLKATTLEGKEVNKSGNINLTR